MATDGCKVCGCATALVVAATYEDYCGPTCEAKAQALRNKCPFCPHSEHLDEGGLCGRLMTSAEPQYNCLCDGEAPEGEEMLGLELDVALAQVDKVAPRRIW